MSKEPIREHSPLTQNDCFTLYSRKKSGFDFPLHSHEELELNLILNGTGSQRIIGDHIGEIEDVELVLVGSNLPHGWFNHRCVSPGIHEITIQFNKDLISQGLLQKNQLAHMRKMFEEAGQGLLFPRENIQTIIPRILDLENQHGFNSVIGLLSIFHDLSIIPNRKLSAAGYAGHEYLSKDHRLEKVFDFMQLNFAQKITLADAASIANMSEEAFSRYIRVQTGSTFIHSLTEIRLGHVSRMLIDTTYSVAEVAYKCGFNNMANFNRIFRERKGCTPKEFKAKILGMSRMGQTY